ncbi:MAG: hypothetical protein J7M25_01340 [Deltaproteobacteria bacterium]|nr:hypothetical protein [Deltaproteobacteria bacterium]
MIAKTMGRAAGWPSRISLALLILVAASAPAITSCEEIEPEVVVVNMTGERILIRGISFQGCRWDQVLAYGEATSPQRCIPGSDHVHFKKFDVEEYCKEQAADGTLDGLCLCDGGKPIARSPVDDGLIDETPLWFNYQSISIKRAEGPGFYRFEIVSDDMEQDFGVPGPYGH